MPRDRTIRRTSSEDVPVFPPRDPDEILGVARFIEQHAASAELVSPDGDRVRLPQEVYSVLINVVEQMRHGRTITVFPRNQILTTQEAADLLGISRPTFVKLLQSGEIPFEQPSRHRHVLLTDVLSYRDRRRAQRRTAVLELVRQSDELGLYGDSAEDFGTALKEARTEAGIENQG